MSVGGGERMSPCSSGCPGMVPEAENYKIPHAQYGSSICLTPFEVYPHSPSCLSYGQLQSTLDETGLPPNAVDCATHMQIQFVGFVEKYNSHSLSHMSKVCRTSSSSIQDKIAHAMSSVKFLTYYEPNAFKVSFITRDIQETSKNVLFDLRAFARSRRQVLKLAINRFRLTTKYVGNLDLEHMRNIIPGDTKCCYNHCPSCDIDTLIKVRHEENFSYVLKAWRMFRAHTHSSSCLYCLVRFYGKLVSLLARYNVLVNREHKFFSFLIDRLEALQHNIAVLVECKFDIYSMSNAQLMEHWVKMHNAFVSTDPFRVEYFHGHSIEEFGSSWFSRMRQKLMLTNFCEDCKMDHNFAQYMYTHRLANHAHFNCDLSKKLIQNAFLYTGIASVSLTQPFFNKVRLLRNENFSWRLDKILDLESKWYANQASYIADVGIDLESEDDPDLGFPREGRRFDLDEGVSEFGSREDISSYLIRSGSRDSLFLQGNASIKMQLKNLLVYAGSRDNDEWINGILSSNKNNVRYLGGKIRKYILISLKDHAQQQKFLSRELDRLLRRNKGTNLKNAERFYKAIFTDGTIQDHINPQGKFRDWVPFVKKKTVVEELSEWVDSGFECLGITKEQVGTLSACVWFLYDVITGINYKVATLRLLTTGTALTKVVSQYARKLYTVIKDCVLENKKRQGPGFWTQGGNDELDKESNESLIKSMAALAYSMFSGKEFDSLLNSKFRLNRVVNMSKFVVSVKNISSFISTLISKGFKFLVALFTSDAEAADDLGKTMPEITEWMQRFDKIDSQHTDDTAGLTTFATAIRQNPMLANELIALKKTSDKWVTRLSVKFSDTRHWSFFMCKFNRFMKFYDLAVNAICTQKMREAPFVVCLQGESGIGKSNMYKHILQNLFAIDNKVLDLGKDVFTREITCEFWDGYNNQPVVYYSDLLQTTDRTVRTLITGEFIQMAQTTPYPLHMAECSAKAASFFNSGIVWTDCNHFPSQADLAELVRAPEAFRRRFNHIIRVRLNNFRNENGGFDSSQATKPFHEEIYSFDVDGVDYDFKGLVVFLYKSWKTHQKKQAQDMLVMPVLFSQEEMDEIKRPTVRAQGPGETMRKVFNFDSGLVQKVKPGNKEFLATYNSEEQSSDDEEDNLFNQAASLLGRLSGSYSYSSEDSIVPEEFPDDNYVFSEPSTSNQDLGFPYFWKDLHEETKYERFSAWLKQKHYETQQLFRLIGRLFNHTSVWSLAKGLFLLPLALSVGWLYPLIDACHSDGNLMAANNTKMAIDRILHGAGTMVMKQMVNSWIKQHKIKTALIVTFALLGSAGAGLLIHKGVKKLLKKRKDTLFSTESGETKTQRHDRKIARLVLQGANAPIVVGDTDEEQHKHCDITGNQVIVGHRQPHFHKCIDCLGMYSHTHEIVTFEQSLASHNVHRCKPCKDKRKKVSPGLDGITSQASHFGESGENALYKVFSAQFRIENMKSGNYIMGSWVKSNVMMVPAHYIRACEDEMANSYFKVFGPNYTLQIHSTDMKDRVENLERDVCLIAIDLLHMPPKPSIYRFLSKPFTQLPRDGALLNPKNFVANAKGWAIERHMIDDITMELELVWNPQEDKTMYQVRNGIGYTADTIRGDCGSLLVVRDDTGCPRVVGAHMGSMEIARRAIATAIDSDLIDFMMTKLMGVSTQGVLCLGPIPNAVNRNVPIYDKDLILILGTLPPDLVPNLAKNTKIRPSCLIDLFPVNTAPAMLGITKGIDPMRIGVGEMARNSVNLEVGHLADATICVGSKLLSLKSRYKENPRLLTEDETLNGSYLEGTKQPDKLIRKMNMKTSAGWPYNLRATKGKTEFVEEDENGRFKLKSFMRSEIDRLENSLRSGEAEPFLFFDCIKDERRPIAKAESGNSRIFSVGPMHFTYLMRKYTSMFQAHCMQNCIDSGSAVGINPHSPQWACLYRRLRNRGKNFMAGDYKKWDKWVPYELMMAVCELVNAFYQLPVDHPDNVVRKMLFSGAFGAKRIALSVVYQANGGMPSGTPGTSVFNSLANEILFRYVFDAIRVEQKIQIDPGRYHELVGFTAYGDDHIVSVSEIIPWFNMVLVKKKFLEMGITYTNADKTDRVVEYIDSEDLTFLKRGFGDIIGNFCFAPLDKDVIRESVMWQRDADSEFDIKCTVRSAMMEMVHHGVSEFLKFRGVLAQKLMVLNKVLPDVSYKYVLDEMRRGTLEPEDLLGWRDPDYGDSSNS